MDQRDRIRVFVRGILAWYARHKRTLPWRDLLEKDPSHRAYLVYVSEVMLREASRIPAELRGHLPRLAGISKDLRRDRELAFYGSEDLTPLSFYSEDDARKALDSARFEVSAVRDHIK